MSLSEKYLEIYRGWSDQKLLDAWKNLHDYNEDAQDGIKTVLKERGLIEKAMEQNSDLEPIKDDDYSTNVFGISSKPSTKIDPESNKPFEAHKNADGIYLTAPLATASTNVWAGCFMGLAISGLVCWAVFAYSGILENWINILILLISLALIGLTIWRNRMGKGFYVLKEGVGGKMLLLIKQGEREIQINEPFSANFYLTKTINRVNGIKASEYFICHLVISSNEHGTIAFQENQKVNRSAPPGWEFVAFDDPRLVGKINFGQSGLNKLKLNEFKNIISTRMSR